MVELIRARTTDYADANHYRFRVASKGELCRLAGVPKSKGFFSDILSALCDHNPVLGNSSEAFRNGRNPQNMDIIVFLSEHLFVHTLI